MAGRTHGQHALPVSFGWKCAVWLDELMRQRERLVASRPRVLTGQLGGAVGTLAVLGGHGLRVERRLMRRLGLGVPRLPVKTAGDRFAEFFLLLAMLSATLGKNAQNVYNLQTTDVDEVTEPLEGKVGSSAMPHKLNPVASGSVVLLGRLLRARASLMLDYVHAEWESEASRSAKQCAAIHTSAPCSRRVSSRERSTTGARSASLAASWIACCPTGAAPGLAAAASAASVGRGSGAWLSCSMAPLPRPLLIACALLAATSGPLGAGPAPQAAAQGRANAARVLTATQGPRQGAWKRSFNPFRSDADSCWPAPAGVYEPLLVFNRATSDYLPWLATGYTWTADNLRLRFTLRAGVLWSDGRPFTARDVAFTFDLLRRNPALDRENVWAYLLGVSARDAATVEFTLKRVYTPGLVSIAQQPIVAEHKWRTVADPVAFDDPSPVGTGPFTEVERFEPTVYELGKNPKYWQAGKPGVDLLRVPLYRTNDEVLAALRAGELDWASLFQPDIEKSWVAADPARRQYWYPDLGPTVLLYLNTRQKPLDDASVRKALSLALDRPRVMKEALNDYAPPADATGLADSQKKWKDPALTATGHWTTRDLVQANRLLDAAGLARGPDELRVGPGGVLGYEINVVQGWTDWMAAAEILRQNLAELGITASVKALEYNDWDDALRRGRFSLSLGFGARGPTPYHYYRGLLDGGLVRPAGTRAEGNFERFSSQQADTLLRRFETVSDERAQRTLGLAIQKLVLAEAPSLPLYASPLWGVFNTSRLAGFPSRFRPYASAAPGGADTLPVLVEVKPR